MDILDPGLTLRNLTQRTLAFTVFEETPIDDTVDEAVYYLKLLFKQIFQIS